MTSPNAIRAGSIPGFELGEMLGEGGMGRVYAATDHATGRRVAIKFLASPIEDRELQSEKRFEREIRIATSLEHPNIIRVLDHGQADGMHYFVMEFADGISLRRELEERKRLELPHAIRLLEQIGSALAYLESREIVHRDIKPENIIISPSGEVKITDFGISLDLAERGNLTSTGQFLGSMDYVAPEQRARLPVGPAADQYAFAVIAYEMLTGKRPLGAFKQASSLNPRLHPRVDEVLQKALREDPDERYAHVLEFQTELLAAIALKPPSRYAKHLKSVALATAACILVAGAGAWAWSYLRPPAPALDAKAEALDPAVMRERVEQAMMIAEHAKEFDKAFRLRDALGLYDEAVELAPREIQIRIDRALIYKRLNLTAEAIGDLEVVLEVDPNHADAWAGKGSILVQLRRFDEAKLTLDRALGEQLKSW